MRHLLALLCFLIALPLHAQGIFIFGHDGLHPSEPSERLIEKLALELRPLHPQLALAGQGGGLSGELPPKGSWQTAGVPSALGPSFRRSDLTAVVIAPSAAEAAEGINPTARLIDWIGAQSPAARVILTDPTPDQTLTEAIRTRFPQREITYVAAPPSEGIAGLTASLVQALDPAPSSVLKLQQVEAGRLPTSLATPSVADPALAAGLAHLVDWDVAQPFIDIMKTARPWVGHKSGQWGGMEFADLKAAGALSPEGWPLHLPQGIVAIEAMLLADLPPSTPYLAGRYVMTWAGEGQIDLTGGAKNIQREGKSLRFDLSPVTGGAGIKISRVDTADPIRDIKVIREDRLPLYQLGARFNPEWLAVVRDLRMVRFMDWMQTNHSPQQHWEDRPTPSDFSYQSRGAPLEVMIELANLIGADPWFTLPHGADDDYVRQFATMVERDLSPKLRVHAEWSNEVWNFIFGQSHWSMEQAKALWNREGDAWMQYAGLRAAEVADIWAEVFQKTPHRLERVIGVHTGWKGLEQPLLHAPLVTAMGRPEPWKSFDSYAITGYFGDELYDESRRTELRKMILEGDPKTDLTAAIKANSLKLFTDENLPYHAKVAKDLGLKLIMYEGGTHLVAHGPDTEDEALTEALITYNYSPEMAALYGSALNAWAVHGQGPFNAFVEVSRPSRWGSWGAKRDLADDNPRWQMLEIWNRETGAPWESREAGTFDAALWRSGTEGDERIEMRKAPRDILLAGGGNDTIKAYVGQRIDGGSGRDRVELTGRASEWDREDQDGLIILKSQEGKVYLLNIEEAAFSDGSWMAL